MLHQAAVAAAVLFASSRRVEAVSTAALLRQSLQTLQGVAWQRPYCEHTSVPALQ